MCMEVFWLFPGDNMYNVANILCNLKMTRLS